MVSSYNINVSIEPQPMSADMSVSLVKPFSTNAPLIEKPGSWFLLAKCLKNTCGRVTF